jgi:hypothetical protein
MTPVFCSENVSPAATALSWLTTPALPSRSWSIVPAAIATAATRFEKVPSRLKKFPMMLVSSAGGLLLLLLLLLEIRCRARVTPSPWR